MRTINPVEHYLLTISTLNDFHMHGYVMSDDMTSVERVGLKMMDELEKMHANALPMILCTKLDPDGVELVRRVIPQEAKDTLKTATDFHMSAWAIPAGHPVNDMLMELH